MNAIYIAMQAEAQPIIDALNAETLPLDRIGKFYQAELDGIKWIIATSGQDRHFGVDCVGMEPAAVIADFLINEYKITTLYNMGTCGAISSLNAKIAETFIVTPKVFTHDHRIPLPEYDKYGEGNYDMSIVSEEIAEKLDIRKAILSTGNSLDHTEKDLEIFKKNNAQIKDMEGAALAWVCRQYDVSLVSLKVVTDIFDLPHPAADQFIKNLTQASQELAKKALILMKNVNL